MKFMKTHYNIFLVLIMVVFASCKDLTDLNVNPNAVDPTTVNPNFMVPTVITATAQPYQDNNYQGDVAGAMSYVQKSGWGSGLNNFTWVDGHDWGGFYGNLRNIYHLIDRSKTEGMEFHEGLGLIMKAFNLVKLPMVGAMLLILLRLMLLVELKPIYFLHLILRKPFTKELLQI
jgi:hypothetical protein